MHSRAIKFEISLSLQTLVILDMLYFDNWQCSLKQSPVHTQSNQGSSSRLTSTFSLTISLSSSPLLSSLSSFSVCEHSPSVLPAGLFCFVSFFHFIRLFWNHVFTCVSFKPNVWASLARLDVSRYFCSENVFSRMRNWRSVNTVRDLRHLRPLGVLMVGLRRK